MANKSVLVTLADKNYVNQAKQLFSSAYWNAGWQGDYLLLAHEIPEKDLAWFRKKGILIYKCKPLEKNKIGSQQHSPSVLNKIYLFTSFFKRWDKIIYIDADCIIRCPLNDALNFNVFSAVDAPATLKEEFIRFPEKTWPALNRFELSKQAFNSGVFAFNPRKIPKNAKIELLNLWKEFSPYSRYGEEGIFNLFYYKIREDMPLTFNILLFSFFERKRRKILKRINKYNCILHFNHKYRPWENKNPFYQEWLNNFKKADSINLKKVNYQSEKRRDIKFESLLKRYIFLDVSYLEKKSKIKSFLNGLMGKIFL